MTVQWLRGCVAVGLLSFCISPSLASDRSPEGALDAAGSGDPDFPVRGVVIPTGFQGGVYSAMVQVAVDGTPLPGATWDLEASFVLPDDRQDGYSGRIVVGEPWTPAVLEIMTTFRPGPYELSLAARESTAGQTGAGRLEGNWPDPGAVPATVSMVAILQPIQAAFLRDGNSRSRGGIARADEEPIQTGLPTAIICVVCRGPMQQDVLRVERQLRGSIEHPSVDFGVVQLQPGEEACAQVRDLIPPGTMTDGFFEYEVSARSS